MCRPIAEGGRRCTGGTQAECATAKHQRNAADRARYAAKKAAAGRKVRTYKKRTVEDVPDGWYLDQTTPPPPATPGDVSPAALRVASAQAAVLRRRLATSPECTDDEWAVLEDGIRDVGGMVEKFATRKSGVDATQVWVTWEQARRECIQVTETAPYTKLEAAARAAYAADNTAAGDQATRRMRELLLTPWVAAGLIDRDDIQNLDGATQLAIMNRLLGGPGTPGGPRKPEEPTVRIDRELAALTHARLEVLQSMRDFGGQVHASQDSHTGALRALQGAAETLPTDWIEASNQLGGLRVKQTRARAHYTATSKQRHRLLETHEKLLSPGETPKESLTYTYTPTGRTQQRTTIRDTEIVTEEADVWEVTAHHVRVHDDTTPVPRGWSVIPDPHNTGVTMIRKPKTRVVAAGETVAELTVPRGADAVEVAAHEFAHRTEHTRPAITHLEAAFLARRADHSPTPEPISPKAGEIGHSDGFGAPYTGRIYPETTHKGATGETITVQHHEILATGIQAALHGNTRYTTTKESRADTDLTHFILGILAAG